MASLFGVEDRAGSPLRAVRMWELRALQNNSGHIAQGWFPMEPLVQGKTGTRREEKGNKAFQREAGGEVQKWL